MKARLLTSFLCTFAQGGETLLWGCSGTFGARPLSWPCWDRASIVFRSEQMGEGHGDKQWGLSWEQKFPFPGPNANQLGAFSPQMAAPMPSQGGSSPGLELWHPQTPDLPSQGPGRAAALVLRLPGGAARLFTDSASPAALIFHQHERICQIFCQRWRLPAGIPGISTQAAVSRYFKHTGEALAGSAGEGASRKGRRVRILAG